MKVKLTSWNREQFTIEHDDIESIEKIVKENINRYIGIEYIDAPIYQKHWQDRPKIDHTSYYTKRTFFVNYATRNTDEGRVCDSELTVIERTKELKEEFEEVYKVIIKVNGYNK